MDFCILFVANECSLGLPKKCERIELYLERNAYIETPRAEQFCTEYLVSRYFEIIW